VDMEEEEEEGFMRRCVSVRACDALEWVFLGFLGCWDFCVASLFSGDCAFVLICAFLHYSPNFT
jgi:hypothetical protein